MRTIVIPPLYNLRKIRDENPVVQTRLAPSPVGGGVQDCRSGRTGNTVTCSAQRADVTSAKVASSAASVRASWVSDEGVKVLKHRY